MSVLLFFYSVSVGINSFIRYNRFSQEFIAKSERFDEVRQHHLNIQKMTDGLKNSESWETLSREKLKMIKPGEAVFLFYDKENQ
ncbi:MAG: FtsB family cell division protein [Candidatus Marinamargulisbacteria bacterium]